MELETIIRVQRTNIATRRVLLAAWHSRDCRLSPRNAGFPKTLRVLCSELEFCRYLWENTNHYVNNVYIVFSVDGFQ